MFSPEAPLVATGMEELASRDSGRLILAEEDGVVSYLDAKKIVVKGKTEKPYSLVNFIRNNNFSVFHQRPSVDVGDKIKKGGRLSRH